IERSEDSSTDRPVALLLTKFDRVLAGSAAAGSEDSPEPEAGISGAFVERLVDDRYGMTRHALAAHAPNGAVFAVSSFGPGAIGNRPPVELHPMGLEGPLSWLADQLEARDRAVMTELWERAPRDLRRLRRSVAAYERRYPRSNRSYEFRGQLKALRRQQRRGRVLRLAAWGLLALGALAGYDALGFQRAAAFEREGDRAAPAIARRWSDLLEWHPSLGVFWPALARQARLKKAEWLVKAADVQVANGTAGAGPPGRRRGPEGPGPPPAPPPQEGAGGPEGGRPPPARRDR